VADAVPDASVGDGTTLLDVLLGRSVGRTVGDTGVAHAPRARASDASSVPAPIVPARMTSSPRVLRE
jgi:hypothetical protein